MGRCLRHSSAKCFECSMSRKALYKCSPFTICNLTRCTKLKGSVWLGCAHVGFMGRMCVCVCGGGGCQRGDRCLLKAWVFSLPHSFGHGRRWYFFSLTLHSRNQAFLYCRKKILFHYGS